LSVRIFHATRNRLLSHVAEVAIDQHVIRFLSRQRKLAGLSGCRNDVQIAKDRVDV
jgi:hypothetical protein